jgi:hypothetical protein
MPRRPVNNPYTITTEFGVPDSYAKFGRHSGVDYAVPKNRPVYAPASGTLTNIVSPTGGNMVQIFDGRYYHRLMHNSSFSRGNGRVNEGDEVAKAGTTGLSTGVHVHWDIADRATPTAFSQFINPATFLATPTNSNQGATGMKIGSEPNWRWRMNLLHRQLVGNWDMSDEVFRSIVGQDAWSVVESWSSHSNAPLAQKYQEVGQVAVNDKWDQQIYNLVDQVKQRDKVIAEIKAKADLSDSLQKKVDALQTEQAQDQATGNAIMRFLGRLFRSSN